MSSRPKTSITRLLRISAWRLRRGHGQLARHITSKVARRTMLLFLLCSVLPLAITGWITIQHTSDYLVDQTRQTLERTAKSHGLQLYERLTLAQQLLRATNRNHLETLTKTTTTGDTRYFDSVADIDYRKMQLIAGTIDDAIDIRDLPSPSISTQLWTARSNNHTASVYLIEFRTVDNSEHLLLAKIDPEFLWPPAEESEQYELCVHNGAGILLHCSQRRQQYARARQYLTAEWPLFLRASFNVADWRITTLQSKRVALEDAYTYQYMLLKVMGAVLAAVLLISAISIRRSHLPLEQLMRAIRKLSSGSFDQPLHITGRNEYAELARSFDFMRQQLGRQFRNQLVLGQIDRCILDSPNVESVIEAILLKTRDLFECQLSAVALFDTVTETLGRLYMTTNSDQITSTRMNWPTLRMLSDQDERQGVVVRHSDVGAHALQPLWDEGAQQFLLMPVITRTRLRAIFLQGYTDTDVSGEQHRLAGDIAERLAVALTSAERDYDLFQQAHYDSLTRLPNRLLFRDRLEQELVHARRKNENFAVLFLDLDRFKNINDSLGHSAGDLLLKVVTSRLQAQLREIDTLARLGGDEFTVILPQISSPSDVTRACDRLLSCMEKPFVLDEHEWFVGTSIGVALFPNSGQTAEELLRNADTAMYRAKQNQRGSYAFYEEFMNQQARARISMEADLRRALTRNQFVLHYQPMIDLRSQRIVGTEVLLRWQHPDRGLIYPDQFISVAEDFGLIVPIGEWVLETACAQLEKWRRQGLPIRSISVNVSVAQLASPHLVKLVGALIRRYHLQAGQLELEITESVLAGDIRATHDQLLALREAGARIALDDFGTGYSSLHYLQQLPIQVIKIDRSFMPKGPQHRDRVMCDTIMAMAHALGMEVVAEGVETLEQLIYLQEHGCPIGQGYYFSQPITAEALTEALQAQAHAEVPDDGRQVG